VLFRGLIAGLDGNKNGLLSVGRAMNGAILLPEPIHEMWQVVLLKANISILDISFLRKYKRALFVRQLFDKRFPQ
jgi:hypothetical protein